MKWIVLAPLLLKFIQDVMDKPKQVPNQSIPVIETPDTGSPISALPSTQIIWDIQSSGMQAALEKYIINKPSPNIGSTEEDLKFWMKDFLPSFRNSISVEPEIGKLDLKQVLTKVDCFVDDEGVVDLWTHVKTKDSSL